MFKVLSRIFCVVLGAVLTIVNLSLDDKTVGNERVNLQSPSLIYASMSNRYANANVMPEDDDDNREAEEADTEAAAAAARFNNPETLSLEDYTITAPADYEDVAKRVRGEEDEPDQDNYDGKFVWTRDTISKVYASDNTNSKVVAQFKKATKAIRISYSGEWSYIRFGNNQKGYILSKNLSSKKVNTPTPTPKPVRRSSGNSSSKSKSSSKSGGSSRGGGFGSFVRRYVGCKYVPGGASPSGFDCSGFTMYCYRAYYGIRLPHGANMQSSYGHKVSLGSAKVGDIIFIDHDHNGKADHVGIYVGGGQMVHASGVKYGVVCVSVSNVKDILMVRRIR